MPAPRNRTQDENLSASSLCESRSGALGDGRSETGKERLPIKKVQSLPSRLPLWATDSLIPLGNSRSQ